MFSHHPDGVGVVRIIVLPAADALHRRDNRREQIRLIRGIDALQYPRQPLKAHPRIHAWRGQVRARPIQVMVILHEHQVPQLHIAVAHIPACHSVGAVRRAIVSQAAILRAVVVVQFAARPARPLIARRPPPVLVVPKAVHPIGGYPLSLPQPARLFVGLVNRRRELVQRYAVALGHKLNGEIHRALLEIIAYAEIAQHLKQRIVRGIPHLFYVRRPKALLRRGKPLIGRRRLPREIRLELHHPRRSQQQRRIAHRNQR